MSQSNTARSTATRRLAAKRLLAWYDANRRVLPWRVGAGCPSDPYRVWLSEIMLQQTTAAAVAPYYQRFLERWPTVESLASARLEEVLAAWAGLGYYARARNLHRAAAVVAGELGGRFPRDVAGLRALPGIGVYTAGAIAAIAFGAAEIAIDANAERVLARFFAVEEPLPKAKPKLGQLGRSLLPHSRAGDFAQALMDLGALICTPRSPSCGTCPWDADCRGRALGIAAALPRKASKRARPVKRGAAFVVRDAEGCVLLEQRPENGLLGAMMQPPMTAWGETFPAPAIASQAAPFPLAWRKQTGIVRHGFTHFQLEIEVYAARVDKRPETGRGRWIAPAGLKEAALPTVMRKILAHASDEVK